MASRETVAVLGAGGTMGFPMARNLARSGISVRAWNRSREKAEPLAKDGVQVCDGPAEAAEGASVILTMLADTDAVIDVVAGEQGAFSALPPATGSGTVDGVIWLQMSTIGEAGTERCADLAGQHEIPFVDAPVAKDARLAAEAAERHQVDVPLVRVIRDRLAEGVPEHGEKDMSATYLTSAAGPKSA